jgi:hypothetical protein
MKNLVKNIVTLLGSLLFSLIMIELLARFFFPAFNPVGKFAFYFNENGVPLGPRNFSGRMWDPAGDYDVPVNINQFGFRDHQDLRQSTSKDIFVVGDSFMFGYGVPEDKRLSNLLEQQLGGLVYNIAIPGDLDDYKNLIRYAQQNGATIKNLIIGVCMENDLGYYYHGNSPAGDHKSVRKMSSPLQTLKEFVGTKTVTYNLLTYAIHQNPFLRKAGVRLGLVLDKVELGLINKDRGKDDKITIDDSVRKLQEISEPFKTIIIIVPSRALWIGNQRAAESAFHNEFVAALKKTGFLVIDMRPYFEAGGNPLQYYFKNDGHWNEKGHGKAAEIISRAKP